MKTRDVLLGAVILCGLVLATKAAQVSVTPEFWAWIATAGQGLAQNAAVKFLVVSFGLFSFASLLAAGFDARAKAGARRAAERARARAIREARARQARTDSIDSTTGSGRPAA